jgi:hypothetical protein
MTFDKQRQISVIIMGLVLATLLITLLARWVNSR